MITACVSMCTTSRDNKARSVAPLHLSCLSQEHLTSAVTDRFEIIAQTRLFNKARLARTLGLAVDKEWPDSQLICAGLHAFGQRIVEHLQGKFLIAAWDIAESALLLIQDPTEYGAFFYTQTEHHFYFSTQLSSLLKHLPKKPQLNWSALENTERSLFSTDATAFNGITTLGPGHILRLQRQNITKYRYWTPEDISINDGITLDEAVSEFLGVFETAVKARLPKNGHAASMLSGGLDSGSVSCFAARLLPEGKTLTTFSHIPKFTPCHIPKNRLADETVMIERILQKYSNIEGHLLSSDNWGILDGVKAHQKAVLSPIHGAANAFWICDIAETAAKNHDVILSGEMGNGTISLAGHIMYSPFIGLPPLAKLRWIKSRLRSATDRSFFKKSANPETHFYHDYLMDLTEINAQKLKTSLEPEIFLRSKPTSSQELALRILRPGNNPRLKHGYQLAQHYNITYRDPTADKHLVELILSLPNQFFLTPEGKTKGLIKRAMREILPNEVLFQTTKGLQGGDLIERIQKDLPEMTSIIKNYNPSDFGTNALKYNKQQMLSDIDALSRHKLPIVRAQRLVKSVGVMQFIKDHG